MLHPGLDFVYFRLCPKEFAVKAGLGKCIFSSLACSKLDFSQGLERLMRDSLQPADSLPPHGNLKSRQALQTSNQLRIVLSTWSSVALANGGGTETFAFLSLSKYESTSEAPLHFSLIWISQACGTDLNFKSPSCHPSFPLHSIRCVHYLPEMAKGPAVSYLPGVTAASC